MKHKIFALCAILFLVLGCNLPPRVAPTQQFQTPVVVPTTNTVAVGGTVTLNNVSLTVPMGVAQGAQSETVAAVTDTNNAPLWEVAPEHLKFTLTGYQIPVENSPVKPQIFVYPADEYAKLNSAAAGEIQKLKTILGGAPLTKEGMPAWVMNAGQLMSAKRQVINFQSGRGVRFLTEYAQYPAIINNRELFYLFHGLTNDSKYYIVAMFPARSSILPEEEKPESPVPQGGVSLPAGATPNDAYYEDVTKALDVMYEDSFNPSLFQLDALVQSITVAP
jgi:hypothetical protein